MDAAKFNNSIYSIGKKQGNNTKVDAGFIIADQNNFETIFNPNNSFGINFMVWLKKTDFSLWKSFADNERRINKLNIVDRENLLSLFNKFHITRARRNVYVVPDNFNAVFCCPHFKKYRNHFLKLLSQTDLLLYRKFKKFDFLFDQMDNSEQKILCVYFNQYFKSSRKNIQVPRSCASINKQIKKARLSNTQYAFSKNEKASYTHMWNAFWTLYAQEKLADSKGFNISLNEIKDTINKTAYDYFNQKYLNLGIEYLKGKYNLIQYVEDVVIVQNKKSGKIELIPIENVIMLGIKNENNPDHNRREIQNDVNFAVEGWNIVFVHPVLNSLKESRAYKRANERFKELYGIDFSRATSENIALHAVGGSNPKAPKISRDKKKLHDLRDKTYLENFNDAVFYTTSKNGGVNETFAKAAAGSAKGILWDMPVMIAGCAANPAAAYMFFWNIGTPEGAEAFFDEVSEKLNSGDEFEIAAWFSFNLTMAASMSVHGAAKLNGMLKKSALKTSSLAGTGEKVMLKIKKENGKFITKVFVDEVKITDDVLAMAIVDAIARSKTTPYKVSLDILEHNGKKNGNESRGLQRRGLQRRVQGFIKPPSAKTGSAKTGSAKPRAAKPRAAKPRAAKPRAAKPAAARLDTARDKVIGRRFHDPNNTDFAPDPLFEGAKTSVSKDKSAPAMPAEGKALLPKTLPKTVEELLGLFSNREKSIIKCLIDYRDDKHKKNEKYFNDLSVILEKITKIIEDTTLSESQKKELALRLGISDLESLQKRIQNKLGHYNKKAALKSKISKTNLSKPYPKFNTKAVLIIRLGAIIKDLTALLFDNHKSDNLIITPDKVENAFYKFVEKHAEKSKSSDYIQGLIKAFNNLKQFEGKEVVLQGEKIIITNFIQAYNYLRQENMIERQSQRNLTSVPPFNFSPEPLRPRSRKQERYISIPKEEENLFEFLNIDNFEKITARLKELKEKGVKPQTPPSAKMPSAKMPSAKPQADKPQAAKPAARKGAAARLNTGRKAFYIPENVDTIEDPLKLLDPFRRYDDGRKNGFAEQKIGQQALQPSKELSLSEVQKSLLDTLLENPEKLDPDYLEIYRGFYGVEAVDGLLAKLERLDINDPALLPFIEKHGKDKVETLLNNAKPAKENKSSKKTASAAQIKITEPPKIMTDNEKQLLHSFIEITGKAEKPEAGAIITELAKRYESTPDAVINMLREIQAKYLSADDTQKSILITELETFPDYLDDLFAENSFLNKKILNTSAAPKEKSAEPSDIVSPKGGWRKPYDPDTMPVIEYRIPGKRDPIIITIKEARMLALYAGNSGYLDGTLSTKMGMNLEKAKNTLDRIKTKCRKIPRDSKEFETLAEKVNITTEQLENLIRPEKRISLRKGNTISDPSIWKKPESKPQTGGAFAGGAFTGGINAPNPGEIALGIDSQKRHYHHAQPRIHPEAGGEARANKRHHISELPPGKDTAREGAAREGAAESDKVLFNSLAKELKELADDGLSKDITEKNYINILKQLNRLDISSRVKLLTELTNNIPVEIFRNCFNLILDIANKIYSAIEEESNTQKRAQLKLAEQEPLKKVYEKIRDKLFYVEKDKQAELLLKFIENSPLEIFNFHKNVIIFMVKNFILDRINALDAYKQKRGLTPQEMVEYSLACNNKFQELSKLIKLAEERREAAPEGELILIRENLIETYYTDLIIKLKTLDQKANKQFVDQILRELPEDVRDHKQIARLLSDIPEEEIITTNSEEGVILNIIRHDFKTSIVNLQSYLETVIQQLETSELKTKLEEILTETKKLKEKFDLTFNRSNSEFRKSTFKKQLREELKDFSSTIDKIDSLIADINIKLLTNLNSLPSIAKEILDIIKTLKSEFSQHEGLIYLTSEYVKNHRNKFNLKETVYAILRGFLSREVERGKFIKLTIDISPNIFVFANKASITPTLRNIIENVIEIFKLNPKFEYKIAVKAEIDPYSKKVKIFIEDNGPGVHPAMKQSIFVGVSTNSGGFGLQRVKSLVEANGGTIAEYGELGKGAKFVIELPSNDMTPFDPVDGPGFRRRNDGGKNGFAEQKIGQQALPPPQPHGSDKLAEHTVIGKFENSLTPEEKLLLSNLKNIKIESFASSARDFGINPYEFLENITQRFINNSKINSESQEQFVKNYGYNSFDEFKNIIAQIHELIPINADPIVFNDGRLTIRQSEIDFILALKNSSESIEKIAAQYYIFKPLSVLRKITSIEGSQKDTFAKELLGFADTNELQKLLNKHMYKQTGKSAAPAGITYNKPDKTRKNPVIEDGAVFTDKSFISFLQKDCKDTLDSAVKNSALIKELLDNLRRLCSEDVNDMTDHSRENYLKSLSNLKERAEVTFIRSIEAQEQNAVSILDSYTSMLELFAKARVKDQNGKPITNLIDLYNYLIENSAVRTANKPIDIAEFNEILVSLGLDCKDFFSFLEYDNLKKIQQNLKPKNEPPKKHVGRMPNLFNDPTPPVNQGGSPRIRPSSKSDRSGDIDKFFNPAFGRQNKPKLNAPVPTSLEQKFNLPNNQTPSAGNNLPPSARMRDTGNRVFTENGIEGDIPGERKHYPGNITPPDKKPSQAAPDKLSENEKTEAKLNDSTIDSLETFKGHRDLSVELLTAYFLEYHNRSSERLEINSKISEKLDTYYCDIIDKFDKLNETDQKRFLESISDKFPADGSKYQALSVSLEKLRQKEKTESNESGAELSPAKIEEIEDKLNRIRHNFRSNIITLHGYLLMFIEDAEIQRSSQFAALKNIFTEVDDLLNEFNRTFNTDNINLKTSGFEGNLEKIFADFTLRVIAIDDLLSKIDLTEFEALQDMEYRAKRLPSLPGEILKEFNTREGLLKLTPEYIKSQRGKISLNGLIAEVLKEFKGREIESGKFLKLNVVIPEECVIYAEEISVKSVIRNLCENAVKIFKLHGKGDSITITVEIDRAAEAVKTYVEDNGPGVTEGDKERIFEGYSTTQALGGGGFGLQAARKYIEANGGTIDLCDNPGKGAKFVIDLPLNDKNANNTPPIDPIDGPTLDRRYNQGKNEFAAQKIENQTAGSAAKQPHKKQPHKEIKLNFKGPEFEVFTDKELQALIYLMKRRNDKVKPFIAEEPDILDKILKKVSAIIDSKTISPEVKEKFASYLGELNLENVRERLTKRIKNLIGEKTANSDKTAAVSKKRIPKPDAGKENTQLAKLPENIRKIYDSILEAIKKVSGKYGVGQFDAPITYFYDGTIGVNKELVSALINKGAITEVNAINRAIEEINSKRSSFFPNTDPFQKPDSKLLEDVRDSGKKIESKTSDKTAGSADKKLSPVSLLSEEAKQELIKQLRNPDMPTEAKQTLINQTLTQIYKKQTASLFKEYNNLMGILEDELKISDLVWKQMKEEGYNDISKIPREELKNIVENTTNKVARELGGKIEEKAKEINLLKNLLQELYRELRGNLTEQTLLSDKEKLPDDLIFGAVAEGKRKPLRNLLLILPAFLLNKLKDCGFLITEEKARPGEFGSYDKTLNIIQIEHMEKIEYVETVFHEIFHAVYHNAEIFKIIKDICKKISDEIQKVKDGERPSNSFLDLFINFNLSEKRIEFLRGHPKLLNEFVNEEIMASLFAWFITDKQMTDSNVSAYLNKEISANVANFKNNDPIFGLLQQMYDRLCGEKRSEPAQNILTTGGIGKVMPSELSNPEYPQNGPNRPAPFSQFASSDPGKRAEIERLKKDLKDKSIPAEERLDKINRKVRELYQNKIEELLRKDEELLRQREKISKRYKKLQLLSKESRAAAKKHILTGELLKIVKENLEKDGFSLKDAVNNKELLVKKVLEITVNMRKEAYDLQNKMSVAKKMAAVAQKQTRALLDEAQNLYIELRDELPENEFSFANKSGKLLDNMIFGTTPKVFRRHLSVLAKKLPAKLLEDLSSAGILIIINEKDAEGYGQYTRTEKYIILNNILADKGIAARFDMLSFHEIFHAVKDNKAIFSRIKNTHSDMVKLLQQTYSKIKEKKGLLYDNFAALEKNYKDRGKKTHSDEFYEDIIASLFALYYCDHIEIKSARGTKSLKETFREENKQLFDLTEKMCNELSGK